MSIRSPLLAVLPIQPPCAGERDRLIAEGLTEDVCRELTRFRSLQVIAWSSALAVADLPDREVGRALNASHVLRARLQRLGARLRLTASLIDCTEGTQLWSEVFDASDDEVFTLQDQVVAQIAASLASRLDEATLERSRRKPTESLAAHELTLRGLALLRQGSLEADAEARDLFERALALDPRYARAHGGLALSWFNEWSCQFWERFEDSAAQAYRHAQCALALDDRDALLHVVIGKVLLYRRAFERAEWYLDRALALCPNDADILIQLSLAEVYLGRPELAVTHAERAMRLNPYHPNHYYAFAALAQTAARRFEAAIALAAPIDGFPIIDVPAYLAAAYANLGRIEEARARLDDFVAAYRDWIGGGRAAAPEQACRWLLEINPYRRSEDRTLLAEGFRRLGALSDPAEGVTACPATAADAPPVELPPGERGEEAALVREGRTWRAAYAGRQARLPDLKGLHDIHRLLERPGEEIHCLDLAQRADESYDGDETLDATGRRAIEARIRALQEELAEAEENNDRGRMESLRSELDALIETLSRALGLGGRHRRLGSASEKARTAVTWRIRHALRRISAEHQALGRHLRNSLRTGTFCCYRPERAVDWRLTRDCQKADPPALARKRISRAP